MITCPLCGRKDCKHTAADLGLSDEEFLIYVEFKDDKDLGEEPVIKAELERIKQKIQKAVQRSKRG